jgi:succinate dehydrogenase / fumarate reductase flavoprotein subunit
VKELREEFYRDVFIPGHADDFNPELEKAYRVADFMELGELMIIDAHHRKESCGGHFREEYQTTEGEAMRNDDEFTYVAAWEWGDISKSPVMHKEELNFEHVELKTRSYK